MMRDDSPLRPLPIPYNAFTGGNGNGNGNNPNATPLRGKKRKTDMDDTMMETASSPLSSPNNRNHEQEQYLDNNNNQTQNNLLTTPLKRLKTDSLFDNHPNNTHIQIETPLSSEPSLERVLNTLEKDQLLGIMNAILASYPYLRSHVGSLLPRPTIKSVTALLQDSEKKLNESFPYTKWGQDRSDYSFNRVRPILLEMKTTILYYLDYFTQISSYPTALVHDFPVNSFMYLHYATNLVHRLPVWNSEMHNAETKSELYSRLGKAWGSVVCEIGRSVKEDGKVYGAGMVGEWGRNLMAHNNEVKGAFEFQLALNEFKVQLGWMIGLYPDA